MCYPSLLLHTLHEKIHLQNFTAQVNFLKGWNQIQGYRYFKFTNCKYVKVIFNYLYTELIVKRPTLSLSKYERLSLQQFYRK